MSSPEELIWFLLVDLSGELYNGTTASSVALPSSLVVDQFRDAVKAKYADSHLTGVAPSDLLVYKNMDSFVKVKDIGRKGEPLKSTESLTGLGSSNDMLIVAVPSTTRANGSLANKKPPHKRTKRWIRLNEALELASREFEMKDSRPYTWDEIYSVFKPTIYVQPQRDMDSERLDFLAAYLSYTIKSFRGLLEETKRLHLIAPILICVCSLFDGDVDFSVEEDLEGKVLQARVHLQFMLRRGNKAVCVAVAKKNDMDQGMADVFIGCEAVAEKNKLETVYGIVTDYVQWNFVRNLTDKTEYEECSLRISSCRPDRESLKSVAEKIYAMLSSD